MSRSKRTTELCAAIRMTELLDSNLEPKALRTYVGAAEAENLHDSHLSKRLQQHFHKNGLKSLDLKRMGLEDTRTEAEKSRSIPVPPDLASPRNRWLNSLWSYVCMCVRACTQLLV
jgi:hypothetical protein